MWGGRGRIIAEVIVPVSELLQHISTAGEQGRGTGGDGGEELALPQVCCNLPSSPSTMLIGKLSPPTPSPQALRLPAPAT